MIKVISRGGNIAVKTRGKGCEVFMELIAVTGEIKNMVAERHGEQKARMVMNAIFKAAMNEAAEENMSGGKANEHED